MRGNVLLHFGVLILPLLILSNTAMAATVRELCIDAAGGNPGSVVTVPVTMDDGDGVAGFQIDIDFDPALLSLVGARLGADTIAAGGWSINSTQPSPSSVRILAFSAAGAALDPGAKEMALVDLDVVASEAIARVPFPLGSCVVGDELGQGIPCGSCVQPGLGAAFPRFARVTVDGGFTFRPDPILIESGDWVIWENVDLFLSHTTTSGSFCTPDGLWDGSLLPRTSFARKFPEPPGTIPYFCTPDCTLGHDGEVVITEPIALRVAEIPGDLVLSWSGGGGSYRVLRSPNPRFVGTGQEEFVPDGGATGTTLVHPVPLDPGEFRYYSVINRN